MPKPLELRKVIRILKKYGIIYVTGKGRHPKFYDPETHKSFPVKAHGKKTVILPYALGDIFVFRPPCPVECGTYSYRVNGKQKNPHRRTSP